MYSKLLLMRNLKVPLRVAPKLSNIKPVFLLTRNFSIFHKNESPSLCQKSKYHYSSPILISNYYVRCQGIHSIENKNAVEHLFKEDSIQNTLETKTTAWSDNPAEVIPDESVGSLVTESVQQLNALGEPTFASLGLCNYTPIGLIQKCFELMHVYGNLPWWACIAISTITIRLLVFPLVIKAQKNAGKISKHMPNVQYLTTQMTASRKAGDVYGAQKYGEQLANYTQQNDIPFFKSIMMPLIQLPIFVSMFWGLRAMAANVESMKTGGLWWFTDLSLSDPYFIMPLITSATMFYIIKSSIDQMPNPNVSKLVTYIMKGSPIIFFPFMINFEGAILLYWTTSNFISLGQSILLRRPSVRTRLGLEQIIPLTDQKPSLAKIDFMGDFKETLTNYKIATEMSERNNFNEMQFRKTAVKHPLRKALEYNSKELSNQK